MSENNYLEHEMVSCAIEIQQQYYELLPDWTKYEKQDYDILKQNIGYALFGPPTESHEVNNIKNNTTDSNSVVSYILENAEQLTNVNEGICYNKDAMKIISLIFNQVIEYGKQSDGSIFCGIIYNIIFNIPAKEIKESNQKDNTKEIMKEIQAVPIFKVKLSNYSMSEDIAYIDNNGRVYTDWINYKTNNILPACVMVIPNEGFYQPNCELPITETYSMVWVEVCLSPASSLSTQLVTGIDKASTVLNVGGLGIAIASMFTPIGPIVALAGLATTGASSAWTFGRSIYHLYDRGMHKESLSLTNRSALSAWLGIAGCTMGLAISGGNLLLSRAAQAGQEIGLAARVAYNTTVICNMSINLIGLGYNGYNIVENYQNENRVNWSDVFFFTTHVMFFGNAVLGMKFAHDVIDTSRGNVLKDYEATLRNKRHRKAYNRVRRNATSDAEIVRYIKKVQTRAELLSTTNSNQPSVNKLNSSQPTSDQTSITQPSGNDQSSGKQPNDSQSSGKQPSGKQPNGKQSGSQSSGKQPIGKQPNDSQPNVSQPSGKQTSGKQPNGGQPNSEQSSGKQPNSGQPNSKQPNKSNGSQSNSKQPNSSQTSGKQPNSGQPNGKQPNKSNGSQSNSKQPNSSQTSGKQTNGSQLNVPNISQGSGKQLSVSQPSSSSSNMTRIINDLSFTGGKVKIRNTILLDPLIFMSNFKESSQFGNAALLATGTSSYIALSAKLLKLLTNYYNDCPLFKTISTLPEFESILCEIQYMKNSEDILEKVFSIAINLANRSLDMDPHLVKIVRFIWEYGKVHLKEMGIDVYAFIINNSVNEMLTNIIQTIYDEINVLINRLLLVLHPYLSQNRITNT